MSAAISSVLSELRGSGTNLSLGVEDGLQELDLLLFNSDILLSNLVKFSNESINLNSIVGNLIKTFIF